MAKFLVKSFCSTEELLGILVGWREAEESGIPGGGVKSNDPRKNTKGEGSFLGFFYREPSSALVHGLTLRHESVGSETD